MSEELEKETVTWTCETCPDNPIFTHDGFVKHLADVHGLAKDAKGTKQMIMHADGAKWFSSSYRWMLPGVTAVQSVRTPRTGASRMYWDE